MLSVSKINFERYFEPVFHPVTFALEGSGLLLVTGANGCGKTTLIRVLADILHPTSGQFIERTESMAYVGHFLGIKDDLSVIENLRFMRDFLGTSSRSCGEVIKQVGLGRVSEQGTKPDRLASPASKVEPHFYIGFNKLLTLPIHRNIRLPGPDRNMTDMTPHYLSNLMPD